MKAATMMRLGVARSTITAQSWHRRITGGEIGHGHKACQKDMKLGSRNMSAMKTHRILMTLMKADRWHTSFRLYWYLRMSRRHAKPDINNENQRLSFISAYRSICVTRQKPSSTSMTYVRAGSFSLRAGLLTTTGVFMPERWNAAPFLPR